MCPKDGTCYTSTLWTVLVSSLLMGSIQSAGFVFQSPTWHTHLIRSGKRCMLWALFAKEFHLIEPRKWVLSFVASTFWKRIPLEMRFAPSLLVVWKVLKTIFSLPTTLDMGTWSSHNGYICLGCGPLFFSLYFYLYLTAF